MSRTRENSVSSSLRDNGNQVPRKQTQTPKELYLDMSLLFTLGLSYKKVKDYWANIPPTIDGVLNGFGYISDVDIKSSKSFLQRVFALANGPGKKLALDCGAGVGRVTKYLLMPRFDKVDLLEQEEKFINAAMELIGESNSKLGTLYHEAIQDFKFENNKYYDVIWCQFVLCHINDYDFIIYLKKCSLSLKASGVIIVKESVNPINEIELDESDCSLTRPLEHMMELFENAHLRVALSQVQEGFPDDIYPVHLFLLIPQ